VYEDYKIINFNLCRFLKQVELRTFLVTEVRLSLESMRLNEEKVENLKSMEKKNLKTIQNLNLEITFFEDL
jgi:hypothetical protein